MLVTLVPLFDENMMVNAYSVFTQKKNLFLNPSMLGTGANDGACNVDGLEIIQTMGVETLSPDREIFVPVGHIALFTDIASQCNVPHNRLVFLIDNKVLPQDSYINRIKELRKSGYRFAIRKLEVSQFEDYREILKLMDFVFLNHQKINISKAKIYFSKLFPNIKLCAGNISDMESFEALKAEGGYKFYEGTFFRTPISKGEHEVAPLKINSVQLLGMLNSPDFELTKAADIISRDTALVISLLKIANKLSRNSEITSINHAAAMLGEKELKRWITTVVVKDMCSDKPNEITRLSLLRAKFAENLAPFFNMAGQSQELFLMGLFSVLDVILDMPMDKALDKVKVSGKIREALINKKGNLAPVLDFMIEYEAADWHEVSREMVVKDLKTEDIYQAYLDTMKWYRDVIMG